MTPRQIELARHALGLTNGRKRSYRNYFNADASHADYPEWMAMVQGGYAYRRHSPDIPGALFHLSVRGARKALKNGEKLDRADFPTASA